MDVRLFDYHLPKARIAQAPASPRDSSRLLVFDRKTRRVVHDRFRNVGWYLRPSDVLVFNDTKVFPARLFGRKETAPRQARGAFGGGMVEVFLLRPISGNIWEVLVGGKVRPGLRIAFRLGLRAEAIKQFDGGMWHVRFNKAPKQVLWLANTIGTTPTPPYIKKTAQLSDYQTMYAKHVGSVAAPTAGFHFTKRVMAQLKKKGVQFEFVTLHVGFGTFQPVKVRDIRTHHMHAEYVNITKQVVGRLRQAKNEGRRVIAVGTTSVRVLETVGERKDGYRGWINTFIYPGYRFKMVDGIITNFHLPKSTLLMLVSAFAGRQNILRLYKTAIRKKYRFYSFGDGMLLE